MPVFNLLATPGITDSAVTSEAVAYCERKRAFYIMDTPSPETTDWGQQQRPGTPTASRRHRRRHAVAVGRIPGQHQRRRSTTRGCRRPTRSPGQPTIAPPSGFVAGMFGQEDSTRGVWKSPAGIETTLLGTTGVDPLGLHDRPPAGDPQRERHRLPAAVPRHRHGRLRGPDDGRRRRQHRTAAVEVRGGAAHGAVHRADPLRQPHLGGVRAELAAAVGRPDPGGHRLHAQPVPPGRLRRDTPSEAFVVQCDSTTTTATDVAQRRGQHPGRLRPARARRSSSSSRSRSSPARRRARGR